jgi:hypothetical protein
MGPIGKPKETFRVYGEGSQREDKVTRHYTLMRENQTVAFVERMEAKVVTCVEAKVFPRLRVCGLELRPPCDLLPSVTSFVNHICTVSGV